MGIFWQRQELTECLLTGARSLPAPILPVSEQTQRTLLDTDRPAIPAKAPEM